jgi:hypothetical protein
VTPTLHSPLLRMTGTGRASAVHICARLQEGNRLLRAFTTGVPGLDEWTVVGELIAGRSLQLAVHLISR